MSRNVEKVLVLGEGVAAFLSVVRSLGRQGLEVHVGWCGPDSPALSSRYVKQFHQLPFADMDSGWLEPFIALLEREQFSLVVTTNERAIRSLFPERERLARHARICMMNEKSFNVLFDKVKCNELAESLGLHVPRSRVAQSLPELNEAAVELGFPLVLKPISSYDPSLPTQRRGVLKAYDAAELDKHGQALLEEGAVQVQENFIGRGTGVELLVDRGEILLPFQHLRVHQPLRGGASSYRKSIPLNPELLEASRKLMAELEYSGVIMLEYLIKPTGEWRFVEANARFWGSLPLALAAGADFPYALYQYWTHGRRDFPQTYRTEMYCRDLVGDGLWMFANLRADRSDPTLSTLSLWEVLGESRHILTGRERYDTFTLDDPWPLLAQVGKYSRRALRRAQLRLSEKMASIPPLRRKESLAAIQALHNARRIVFLCWGNICRSPFAGLYAQQIWPTDAEIVSRGLLYQCGRISPREAVDAARQFQVAMEDHRSEILSTEDIATSDVIICFDEQIRRELLKQHPAARSKAFRFGALSPTAALSVSDPFGSDKEVFVQKYEQIRRVLDDVARTFPGRVAEPAALAATSPPAPESPVK